jgi:uncharacterized protein YaiE (UPF0345 family)
MQQFDNVSIVKKANIYFDGKVTSRTVKFPDGTYKTLGIMAPGEYEFGTDAPELMEIMEGDVEVLFPRSSEWSRFRSGEHFEVPGNASFQIRVHTTTDYCCSYLS